MLSSDDLIRYQRHLTLSEIGHSGQLKLQNSRVLCVGAGGLGSPLLWYLAAAGVGTLGIIDHDVVDLSNLQRQILYKTNDLGNSKVLTAKQHLSALNPQVNIQTYTAKLDKSNVLALFQNYDVIVDATDNFNARYLINAASYFLKKPLVSASVLRFSAQSSLFNWQEGPCYRCLYENPPPSELIPNCASAGVVGAIVGVMGSIQATEVIKVLLGLGENLSGRLLVFNGLTMRFNEFAIAKNPDCQVCSQNSTWEQLMPDVTVQSCQIDSISVDELQLLRQQNVTPFLLLDVREPYEYEICNLGGKLVPLSQLPEQVHQIDKDQLIVIHCRSGVRSAQAASFLQQQGYQVKNLTGGILAWIKEIDSSLTAY